MSARITLCGSSGVAESLGLKLHYGSRNAVSLSRADADRLVNDYKPVRSFVSPALAWPAFYKLSRSCHRRLILIFSEVIGCAHTRENRRIDAISCFPKYAQKLSRVYKIGVQRNFCIHPAWKSIPVTRTWQT